MNRTPHSAIGQPRPRDEDPRLLRGRGRYTDDRHYPGEAFMHVLRSPLPAARIVSVDSAAATAMPGVIAVLTAADLAADGIGCIRPARTLKVADGTPMTVPPFRLLAAEHVHFVGDAVAAVVAESAAQAEDAAEAIVVDYAEEPSVVDLGLAGADDAPRVWPQIPGNLGFVHHLGDRAATDAAFAGAAHVTEVTLRVSRVLASTLEPRAAIGRHDPADGSYTLDIGTQAPHRIRDALANDVLGIDPQKLRVIAQDTGGSFGMKNCPYPEYGLVLWAAARCGRAVRWTPRRGEAFLSDHHARDIASRVALALDAAGHFLALRVRTDANLGAYYGLLTPHAPTGNLGGIAGVYRTPAIDVEVRGYHTHTQPTTTYRGAGRPEATYLVERVIDAAAREMGIDCAELRRLNLITPDEMPYQTALTFRYDCGDFPAVMDEALAAADWAGFRARRAQAAARGRLRGIGLSNPIEIAGGPQANPAGEHLDLGFAANGDALAAIGTCDAGQGHATVFRQMLHDLLGIEPDRVRFCWGDTAKVPEGLGTFGSRTMSAAGAAFSAAAEEIVARARPLAATLLDADPDELTYADGRFVADSGQAIGIHELAAARDHAARLTASVFVPAAGASFPNGCHVCEVEVDPETGHVQVESYTVVDDVGTVINPLLLDGQVHGGVAQGLGQALLEEVVFDVATGQLLTGGFSEYALPRADDVPPIRVLTHPVPTRANPLGAKGAGEAGTVGALAAVMNAVGDALAQAGVGHVDMPATPHNVWRALRAAKRTHA